MNKLDYEVEDLKRIQQVLLNNKVEATLYECELIWEKYSDYMCASCMDVPSDDLYLWRILKEYLPASFM